MPTNNTVSPLRQRMIEDMAACKLHIHSSKRFAAFLKRSPDTATADDLRRFQLHLVETGLSATSEGLSPLQSRHRSWIARNAVPPPS
jgi:hypothetical protein